MRTLLAVTFAFFQAQAHSGALEVQARDGHVTIHAQRVPLSRILDRLAQQTGMKVTYESSPPSQAVSANFDRLAPRDAVVRLLEGQGLSYVFRTDPTDCGSRRCWCPRMRAARVPRRAAALRRRSRWSTRRRSSRTRPTTRSRSPRYRSRPPPIWPCPA